MVFDVPASSGGALSILNEFYRDVTEHKNKNIEWIFVISEPFLEEKENIKVLRFPWIKKSWGHRYYFDNIISPKLVKEYNIDKIVSLQNVTIPKVNCEQILYVHQALPFIDYKFSFKENKVFWIYQNIIGKQIIKSIEKSSKVIVQTQWMKNACVKKTGINTNRLKVIPPNINLEIKDLFEYNSISRASFFYPAGAVEYKNHSLIVEAVKKLKDIGIESLKVTFTLNGDETPFIKLLFEEVKKYNLPIEFIGSIERKKVFEYYSKSILIFPSYVETFGLPLLEAKQTGSIIFASDTEFSREILKDYNNVYYFNPFDVIELYNLLLKSSNGEVFYNLVNPTTSFSSQKTILKEILEH